MSKQLYNKLRGLLYEKLDEGLNEQLTNHLEMGLYWYLYDQVLHLGAGVDRDQYPEPILTIKSPASKSHAH